MQSNYHKTIYACFIGYIVHVIVNFSLQLLVDLASVNFVDKIGYRASLLIAHVCGTTGLVLLAVLPELFSDPFIGLLISVAIYAVGGGLAFPLLLLVGIALSRKA